jgi:hypothetical protein
MLTREIKQQVIDKLLEARAAIEDALRLAKPKARYDPVVVSPSATNRLSNIGNELIRIIGELKETQ